MATASEPADRLAAFGNQLVHVHLWLREELVALRSGLDDHLSGAGERPRELRAHCLAFCSALTRHHTAEDGGVFPALAEAHPELRPVLDELAHDHLQVEELLVRLQTLLDGLIALVESHFTYEEKKLVAALNGLSPPLPDDFALRDLTGG
ncbi:hemerythrin domain-containing protein [Streptomyces sp. R302]|uniref:hemerythrin domain-containing protein n=1 Tax=unclassified Streptomyces TaxID=2593676 RepID=UPI00145D46CE|nr:MULTISPECIES: hemerythrin domain-containing protein [unclassified Streptomyces]NML51910.1 hemerythrin domain-containing protein [Streptomyces sp. R301]NML81530.1 hemerythrin domain-containing protein [Streptomyces sp. R302]